MPLFSFAEQYTVLKILYTGTGYRCYLANKIGLPDSQYFVANELEDRELINQYIGEVIALQQKYIPEFVEYFSENSKLYVIFSYTCGNTLDQLKKGDMPAFSYRLSIMEKIVYQLAQYPAVSSFIRTTALFTENIVIEEKITKLNFKFLHLEDNLLQKEKLYQQIGSLLNVIFLQEEMEKILPLKIMSDKCQKGIYRSIGEVLKDLELVSESVKKDAGQKERRLLQRKKLKNAIPKISVAATVFAVGIFLFQKWEEANEKQEVYVAVDQIGTVAIQKEEKPKKEIQKIDIQTEWGDTEEIGQQNKTEAGKTEIQDSGQIETADGELENAAQDGRETGDSDGWLIDESGTRYKIYKVAYGEKLSDIAKAFYRDFTYDDIKMISLYNGIKNPSIIHVGQEIKLPEKK